MKKVRTKKKNLLVRLCIFGFAAYIVVSLLSLQMEIASKKSELAQIQEQIDAESASKKEIERLISYGNDKEYLSKVARDKLDLGFSDEHVYRDAAGS